MNTAACGADYWTFLLARAASAHRLEKIRGALDGLYASRSLASSLGAAPDASGAPLRTDDHSTLCRGFRAWLEARGAKELGASTLDADACDLAYAHFCAMVGAALRKYFRRAVEETFPGRAVAVGAVKKIPRVIEKADHEYAAEPPPRTARAADVVRAMVAGDSTDAVLANLELLKQAFPVLRVKNGFAATEAAAAARRAAYGYAAILANVLFRAPATLADLRDGAGKLWATYIESQSTWDATLAKCCRTFLMREADGAAAVDTVAEIQLTYVPFVTEGRDRSHLHYKVMRAASPEALLHDFREDSPYVNPAHHRAYDTELELYEYVLPDSEPESAPETEAPKAP